MTSQHILESLNMNELANEIHQFNREAGWWDGREDSDKEFAAVKIALIHSEVSEMLEGVRKGTFDDHLPHRLTEEVEAADTFIRLFDLAGARGWDLDGAIQEKREYNANRLDHKKEAREGKNGKHF